MTKALTLTALRSVLIVWAALCGAVASRAQATYRPQYTNGQGWAFQAGEKLDYTVKYSFVKGGEGCFTVRDTTINGRRAQHVVVQGRTTGIADVFFKVRDVYETYLDYDTQSALISKRTVNEGRYHYWDVIRYDQLNHLAHKTVQKKTNPRVQKTDTVPERILDIVGAFYHARNNGFAIKDLAVGDTIYYNTLFGNDLFPLYIIYRGVETVKVGYGKVRCRKFSPLAEEGRLFASKDDLLLWVSDDQNAVPVRIEFKMRVGAFICELTGASGLKHGAIKRL